MQTTHLLDTVNMQLLKAIDVILAHNKSEGLPITSDSAMSKIITPTYPSIVKEMRKGARSVPHKGLIRFVTAFPYDMNYFYNEKLEFIYPPQNRELTKVVEEKLDTSLKDFFFKNQEVSTDTKETLITLKEKLVALFDATSNETKSTLTNETLNTMILFTQQGSLLKKESINPKKKYEIDLTLELSNLKTELIDHQRDYKTLSQKYVALLEKQLG